MERGSTKHGPRLDDEMVHETEAVLPDEEDEALGQPDESRYDSEISRSKRR